MNIKKIFDCYPYRLQENHLELLVLKRSTGKQYASQWRMVGGKVEAGETYWQAALRELKEETGLMPKLFWTLPSVNTFYEHQSDQILTAPAFAAECTNAGSIRLDDEHSDYKWIDSGQISLYIKWPEQRRLMKLLNKLVENDNILSDWILDL